MGTNFLDNELKLYFGDDYVINKYITLKHPTVGDIVEMGEDEYFSIVHSLSAIPSDMKSQLWDMGICWEDVSDFELFCMLSRSLAKEQTKVFFGDLDFTRFELFKNEETGAIAMIQKRKKETIIFDEAIYLKTVTAIRKMHNIVPKIERASTKTVRRILIEEDRKKIAKARDEVHRSQLVPMISFLTNCSDFKYDLKSIRKLPVYAFFDSLSRVQIVKSTTALLQGCYSGMVDTSKINKNEFNFMREIEKNQ